MYAAHGYKAWSRSASRSIEMSEEGKQLYSERKRSRWRKLPKRAAAERSSERGVASFARTMAEEEPFFQKFHQGMPDSACHTKERL